MAFDPNPLFYKMVDIYSTNKTEDNAITICNEGSTRSSKTWDFFHFLYFYYNHNQNKELDCYILRDSLKNSREKTFKEFKKCMRVIGATKITYTSENANPTVKLFGNNIYFRGLDSEDDAEGYPSDIIFINEGLETEKTKVEGIIMRCRKLIVIDWNPKYTKHWCFEIEKQPDAYFTQTTYKQNKHLEKSIIKRIESYEPWEPGSYEVQGQTILYKGQPVSDTNQPPPHKTNIANMTADTYRHKVYSLGLRAAPEGIIFQNVRYIDEWPKDVAYVYGMDFGFTVDPLALVKVGETKTDIYIELLCYKPIERPEEISLFMKGIGISKALPITADSSDKYTGENKGTVEMVSELYKVGWNIHKVKKTKSVMYWILEMKGKRINIINNHLVDDARSEQQNYVMKLVHGIEINQPVDKFNHMWDAARYGFMSLNQDQTTPFIW